MYLISFLSVLLSAVHPVTSRCRNLNPRRGSDFPFSDCPLAASKGRQSIQAGSQNYSRSILHMQNIKNLQFWHKEKSETKHAFFFFLFFSVGRRVGNGEVGYVDERQMGLESRKEPVLVRIAMGVCFQEEGPKCYDLPLRPACRKRRGREKPDRALLNSARS